MRDDVKHLECRIFNMYRQDTFLFDYDGSLGDCLELQKVFKFLLSIGCDVWILTSRISGLEDADFHNHQSLIEQENFTSNGFTVSEQWNNRYGIKYEDLDHYTDINTLATELGLDLSYVSYTEGCSKALHLKREGLFMYVLFDDSDHEIEYVEELSPNEIAIKVDRGNKTYEGYIKELYNKKLK